VAPESLTIPDSLQDDSDVSLSQDANIWETLPSSLVPTSKPTSESEELASPKQICFFSLFFYDVDADSILFHASDQDGTTASTPVKSESPTSIWPMETNLVYIDGSNKLKLTAQYNQVRGIIQDAVEHIRASVMFTDAFPDANRSILFATRALMSAAKGRLPESRDVFDRLRCDKDYLGKLIPLVSVYSTIRGSILRISFQVRGRICLFRSDVKEECAKVIRKLFEDMAETPQRIAQIVERQLQTYNYIFPTSKVNVSAASLFAEFGKR
jgi:hypothetical protein